MTRSSSLSFSFQSACAVILLLLFGSLTRAFELSSPSSSAITRRPCPASVERGHHGYTRRSSCDRETSLVTRYAASTSPGGWFGVGGRKHGGAGATSPPNPESTHHHRLKKHHKPSVSSQTRSQQARSRSRMTPLHYRNREVHEEHHTTSPPTSASGVAAVSTASANPPSFLNDPSLLQPSTAVVGTDLVDSSSSGISSSSATTETTTQQQAKEISMGGVNLPMLQRLCRAQATLLVGATITAAFLSGGDLVGSLQWGTASADAAAASHVHHLALMDRLMWGALATVPMIALSQGLVEQSGHRDAHHVQFATTHAVMSLFGRRRHDHASETTTSMSATHDADTVASSAQHHTTSTAMVICLGLGLTMATAASEELVFRGFLPTALWHWSLPAVAALGPAAAAPYASLALAWMGQAVLFGLGHWHPSSPAGENRLVVQLQSLHGLWHGLVYLVSGGDLVLCMISHMLYDLHIFVETWHGVNNQMDWTEQQLLEQQQQDGTTTRSHAIQDEETRMLQKLQDETHVSDETLAFLKSFFLSFDQQHQMSLSLENVQRAVAYAFWHDPVQPNQRQVEDVFYQLAEEHPAVSRANNDDDDDSGLRLRLHSFVRLLLILRSQTLQQQDQQTSKPTTATANS